MARAANTTLRKPADVRPAPAGYSGTPLPKKLGIKSGMKVRTHDAPEGFEALLGGLPAGAKLSVRVHAPGLTIWFVRRLRDLERGIRDMARDCPAGGMWIAWPKQSSMLATDVKESHIRAAGLAHGLVDYKVCAVSTDWSGLKFAVRKDSRPRSRIKSPPSSRRSVERGRAADKKE